MAGVDSMVWEFVGAEFGVGEVQFKDVCECGYQVGLLLEAGDGTADREEFNSVGDCLCRWIHDVETLDS